MDSKVRPSTLEQERAAILKRMHEMLTDDLIQAIRLAQKVAAKPKPKIKSKIVPIGNHRHPH